MGRRRVAFSGDGYASARASGCHGDGAVAEDGDCDCDDHDPEVYPGATEVPDGKDNDCDGADDEPSVLLVIGYPGQAWGGATWVDEKATLLGYLDDLGLGVDEVEESLGVHDLALFAKCGRAWESYNQDMVDGFLAARAIGTHVSTILASMKTCNEGDVGSDATAQLEIAFKNTVAWMLDL